MPVTPPSAEGANIGAGTIFANYDGVAKHHTTVGRHSFVGSNSVLIAPVTIADGAYVGAGSAVTGDVDPGQIAVARGRQRNIDGWVARARPGTKTAEAAEAASTRHTDASSEGQGRGVTGILKTTEKNLMVFAGRANPELAQEVAALLKTELVPTSAYDFANGEIYVRYEESVRGSDAFVIQSHTTPINEAIMEQLIMVDALKRASAKRITVVLPFYGYARQDKKHRGREPISARLMADLFKTAGANRLMAVDLHTAQIQGFFDGPVDHLMALPILSEYVREKYGHEQLAVVSPDAGRIKVAEQWSERLGGAPLAFIHKTRDINRPNETVANRVVGEVQGRICVLVDDMIDTGGTITKAADALMAEGAAGVVIAATHAILSGPGDRPAQGLHGLRGHRHQHAADRRGPRVRQAHGPVDRAADQPGDPGGLRGRLGDEPLRRPRLRRGLVPRAPRPQQRLPQQVQGCSGAGAGPSGGAGWRTCGLGMPRRCGGCRSPRRSSAWSGSSTGRRRHRRSRRPRRSAAGRARRPG